MNIRFKIIFILLFSTLQVHSQSIDEVFQLANEQFQQQHYESALKLYQRVIFFSEDKYYFTSYKNMATCEMVMGNQENALNHLDIAYFSAENDSIRNEITFQKISSLLLSQNYQAAHSEILALDTDLSEYFDQKRDFYFGIIYFATGEYDKSEQNFTDLVDDHDTITQNRLAFLFEKNKKVDRINPKTAKILSIIIPGAGQFYIGDVKNGLNSLLLNSGIAFLFFSYAQSTSFINATISVVPWYTRYYMGGYQNAEKLAIEKKQKKRAIIYNDIITLLYEYRQQQELN